MLVVMNTNATEQDIERVIRCIESKGFEARVCHGETKSVVHAIGIQEADKRDLTLLKGVFEVLKISTNYRLTSRSFQSEDTIIEVNGVKFGDKYTGLIAGPCAVESYDQLDETAQELSESNVKILRGGAFKPRTSPYAFQGLGEEGLKILRSVADNHGMAVTSEIMDVSQLDLFMKYVDIFQVGARNMQNFNLLKELGTIHKPVVLKRGLSSTFEEWLMSAEYIMAGGNGHIILCERGIRTFESYTRNTLDLSAIPYLKKVSHLPVIVDPSHATGLAWMVPTMSKAAVACGADGIIVEVHNNPQEALCDGEQSITPNEFDKLMNQVRKYLEFEGKTI